MRKIMFNDKYGLTEAVLERSKTMTRRIIPQSVLNKAEEYQQLYYNKTLDGISLEDALRNMADEGCIRSAYKVGEMVGIAQSYKDLGFTVEDTIYSTKSSAAYNNKMFVRAIDMRHQIRITDIKVERLQDISEEDCLREGVIKRNILPFNKLEIVYQVPNSTILKSSPREAFASLIDKVSGKGTWDSNPYVFAYSFELVR